MKKSLEQAKEDFEIIKNVDTASKMGVQIVDFDKFRRYQKTIVLSLFVLFILTFTFEILYGYHQGRYDRAVSNCYSYFRNLQGSQIIEICKAVFK